MMSTPCRDPNMAENVNLPVTHLMWPAFSKLMSERLHRATRQETLQWWHIFLSGVKTTCPKDTNNDGDCGSPSCPYCGQVVRLKNEIKALRRQLAVGDL